MDSEMSIIRLSLVKDRLFAPTPVGTLEDRDYDPAAGVEHGFLEGSTYVEGGGQRTRATAIKRRSGSTSTWKEPSKKWRRNFRATPR